MGTKIKTVFYILIHLSFSYANAETNPAFFKKNSLNWPIKLSQTKRRIGPVLHQYQEFPGADHYFHEGVDLLTKAGQNVFAPISGAIDGGYYAYKTMPDGRSEKTYISIRDIEPHDKEAKLWGDDYFELSITTPEGFRFEFHHINRALIPKITLDAIYSQTSILKGSVIGRVIEWPNHVLGGDYHHIHYSIVSPTGIQLNPFWFSKNIKDSKPPEVSKVYFLLNRPCSKAGGRLKFSVSRLSADDHPTHILLNTRDHINGNIFPHPPTTLTARFSNGKKFKLDFSYSLDGVSTHRQPTLKETYADRICIGDPSYPFVIDGSNSFDFYMKIPIPENFSGSVDISVSDYAGNQQNTLVNIKN